MPTENAARRLLPAMLLALVAVLFVTSIAAAQSQSTQSSTFTQTCIITGAVVAPSQCIGSAFPYMAIGILVSFMIIALVYMLGEVFNYTALKNWYKSELWEVTKSLIIIGVIFFSLVIMSAIASALAGTPQAQTGQGSFSTNIASLYSVDNTYLAQQLNNSYNTYAAVLGLSEGIGFLKSIILTFWLPVPLPYGIGAVQSGSRESIFQTNFLTSSAEDPSFATTSSVTNLIAIPTLIAFQVQYDMFYYIVAVGLGVMIPLGLIFRAFPFVRSIGGTLISIGIGVAIIYPSLLVVLNMPVSNYLPVLNTVTAQSSACPFSAALACGFWNAGTSLYSSLGAGGIGTVTGAIPIIIAFGPRAAGINVGSIASSSSLSSLLQNTASSQAGMNNLVQTAGNGFLIGFTTPLFGIKPTLNYIINNALISILQFILFAIDLLVGLLLTNAVIGLVGGKLRLGIGKLSIV